MMTTDFIIVGQGIAGSMLALELLERGKRVLIIDDAHASAACLVAAGVLNPITGKRLVKSWRSDVALPFAKNRYLELEKKLGRKFFRERKILQLCKSTEEAELWQKRKGESGYAEFLGEKMEAGAWKECGLNDNFGSFFINSAAWVEPPAAMAAFTEHFKTLGILREEKFDFSRLKISENPTEGVIYGDVFASAIIFCEGWRMLENPYFKWLPLRPAKGEILALKVSGETPEHIMHREKWVMKFSDEEIRIGSTWDRENFDNIPTRAAEAELLSCLPKVIGARADVETLTRAAGVRPCTLTTRPFLGAHPEFENAHVFNGFGSKGFALSPYFAEHFASHLIGRTPLDAEADCRRHARKFFNRSPL